MTPLQVSGAAPLQVATNVAALASGSTYLTGSFNNVAGSTLNAAPTGMLKIVWTTSSTPSGGTAINVYVLTAQDPTVDGTYDDGSAGAPGVIPGSCFAIGVVPVDATLTSFNRGCLLPLPPGRFKLLFYNNGTGQSMQANWNAYLAPYTQGF